MEQRINKTRPTINYNAGNTIVTTKEEAQRFGNFLFRLRVDSMGISKRTDAAKKMKISAGYLYSLESGYPRFKYMQGKGYCVVESYCMPTRKMLKAIARAYKDAITYNELCLMAGYPIPVKRVK